MANNSSARRDDEDYSQPEIRNVRRVVAANDNQRTPQAANNNRPNPRPTNSRPKIKIRKAPAKSIRKKRKSWKLFFFIISTTGIIYPLQITFAIYSLVGFAVMAGMEVVWLADTITFGAASTAGFMLYLMCAVLAMLCGLVTYIWAAAIYTSRRISLSSGVNLLVLALCFVGFFIPVLNLAPLMWGWCLYMTLYGKRL